MYQQETTFKYICSLKVSSYILRIFWTRKLKRYTSEKVFKKLLVKWKMEPSSLAKNMVTKHKHLTYTVARIMGSTKFLYDNIRN